MLSFSHLILLFLVVLLVFGPKKLPEVARTISKAMAEFHRLSGDFQETLQREMRQLEREALEESRPKPSPPLAVPVAVAADPGVPASGAELTSHDVSVSDGANERLTVAAVESTTGEAPQESETLNQASASSGAASSTEALPYYDVLFDTAVASGIEWPPEAPEATDAKSRESAVTAPNLPGTDSPQLENPAEEKSPATAGAETPIDGHHPTAA